MAIVPGLFSYYWIAKSSRKYTGLKFLFTHLIFFSIVFNVHYFLPGYNIPQILQVKQMEFFCLAIQAKPGSFITINGLEPNFLSVLKNTPQAIGNTFFNPSIFKIHSPLILFSALENLFIIMIVIISILSFNVKKILPPLFYFSLFFVLILFTLIGLVTPIVGAIVRYKAVGSMFILIGLLTFFDREMLRKRLGARHRKAL